MIINFTKESSSKMFHGWRMCHLTMAIFQWLMIVYLKSPSTKAL